MYRFPLFVFAIVVMAFAASSQTMKLSPEQKLRYAEGIIQHYYVDTVDTDTIVDEAIRAMLKTLDPHSAYSTPEETRELNEPLNGNFSGIGIQFNMATDTLYVIQTVAGGPSEKLGILPGDRILYVNDTIIAGVKMRNTDVMKRLRGPKGSVVNVKVKRSGVDKLIDFAITRDDIPIYSVDASYMIDPSTGYIRISRFAEETPKEFSEALEKLRAQGLKNLVIDLQDNGGGYLNAAQELAAKLLGKGDLIVYTEAPRSPSYTYIAPRDGEFRDGRVVVMVNQYSASASEILSGAIQDHDRGVIVGRRTFGKGLVQRPFPFPDGSMIRLTVSKYYTPSGRCIQKPYVKGHTDDYNADMFERNAHGEFMSADSIKFSEAERHTTLRNKRTVYGGGGIMPDRFVPIDTMWYTPYYRDIMAKGILYKYVLNYVDAHRKDMLTQHPTIESFIESYSVTPEMEQEIITRAENEGINKNDDQYDRSRDYMLTVLKALIARDIYDDSAFYRITNDLNPVYVEAIKVINDPALYKNILGD